MKVFIGFSSAWFECGGKRFGAEEVGGVGVRSGWGLRL